MLVLDAHYYGEDPLKRCSCSTNNPIDEHQKKRRKIQHPTLKRLANTKPSQANEDPISLDVVKDNLEQVGSDIDQVSLYALHALMAGIDHLGEIGMTFSSFKMRFGH
jgi:hypothetical protein